YSSFDFIPFDSPNRIRLLYCCLVIRFYPVGLFGLSLRRVGGMVRAADLRCMGKREQNICHYTPDCKELSKN
ncbi:MAG: hypothetical protein QNL83_03420, partial [OM182 bacterium]